MCRKRILILFLLIFSGSLAFADTFVVTSNADSGPGTLREALTLAAANGSAVKDLISFNLPGTGGADRIITLVTQLPDLSSNLVIDGTTQSGAAFGKSNARVKVATPNNYNAINIFEGLSISNVELYGLYIYDQYDIITSYPDLKQRIGVKFINCTNIIIGSANKGNLIRGFNLYSLDLENTDNIKIQNNIIGLGESNTVGDDGNGHIASYTGIISLVKCNHISLGGNSNEGNIIFTMVDIHFYQQTNNIVSIKSNNFCVYQDGISTEWYFEFYRYMIQINSVFSNDLPNTEELLAASASVNMDISNNVSGSQIALFGFQFIKGVVNFTNNYFNIARDGITDIKYLTLTIPPQLPIGVSFSSAQFNIGSNDISKKNFFNNVDIGVSVSGDPNVFLRYNEFKCVATAAYKNSLSFYTNYTLPVVAIGGIAGNGAHSLVNGTSTPNAVIDIYSSENCRSACSIRSYLQTVTADNAGKWQADVSNLTGIFYVSATLNNQTSEYKTFEVNSDNVNIQHMRCNDQATITGLKVPQGVSYYWTDNDGAIISHDLDLIVHKAGKYRLVLGEGCITSQWFEILDNRIRIYDVDLKKTNISCGTANGAIKDLFVYDPENKIKETIWTGASNTIVGNTVNVEGLIAGSYLLTVTTTDGCSQTYGPVILTNTTGPNIDESTKTVRTTPCGQSTGAITNINVTGTNPKYSWKNELGQEVAITKDLTNQPAGKYTLQVTDDTECGPVYSRQIEIAETNGIALNIPASPKTDASCNKANGSITGITAPGATKFEWRDANNNLKGTDPDLKNVPAGAYQLTASNSFGCSKTTQVFQIVELPGTTYPFYTITQKNTCFGQTNGSVSVITDATVKTMRWVNGSGTTINSGQQINGLVAGTYKLYFTDQNDCESLYGSYTITEIPQLQIVPESEQKTDDECDLNTGSIKNIQITGGQPPYTYKWYNASETQIATTSTVTGLKAGSYKLVVNDASGCSTTTENYTIAAHSSIITPPAANNVQLCTPGEAFIMVNGVVAGHTYHLYQSANSMSPLAEQSSGRFKVTAKANTSFYISQASGSCESTRTEVKIVISLSAINITNTITPNGDGINDYWRIDGIENYPNALVQVFNRYGQKVFESKGYPQPFNGTANGKPIPYGAYYYIINLNKNCNILSGSLTIIR